MANIYDGKITVFNSPISKALNKQPADRGSYKFILKFIEKNESYEIDRPGGFDSISIGLEQEKGRYARHLTFGDTANLKFTPRILKLGHQFEKIVKEYQERGHETRIEIWVYDEKTFIFSAEFQSESIETNFVDYFRVPVEIKSYKKIIESRSDVEVNLLSDKNIDDQSITPMELKDITLKAKEILTISKYSTGDKELVLKVKENYEPEGYIFGTQIMGNIKNSLTYTPSAHFNEHHGDVFGYGTLINTGQEMTIRVIIDNLRANIFDIAENPTSLYYGLRLRYSIAVFNDNGKITQWIKDKENIFSESGNLKELVINHKELEFTLPKNSKISFFTYANVDAEANDYLRVQPHGTITFEAVDIYQDLTTKSAPMIEVGKQVIKSITGGEVNIKAPMFELGSRYYYIHALSGFLVRGYPPYNPADLNNSDNKPFIATWANFENVIRLAFNCDWQLVNNEIRILQHHQFYKDKEAYKFNFTISKNLFNSSPNERYKFNKLNFKYKTFEDNKDNTIDSIHTESGWVLPNSRLSDTESLEIEYIADSYKIEYARREGLITEGTKAKTDDDSIYMVDTYRNLNDGKIVNATNQYVQGGNMFSPNTMYNLRLTLKRLLFDNYKYYIANLTQLVKGNIRLKHTYFKNNGMATTFGKNSSMTTDIFLKENEDISESMVNYIATPLITDKLYSVKLNKRIKLNELFTIIDSVQETNGYITFPLEEGGEIKLYVTKLEYDKEKEIIEITGEEKYIK